MLCCGVLFVLFIWFDVSLCVCVVGLFGVGVVFVVVCCCVVLCCCLFCFVLVCSGLCYCMVFGCVVAFVFVLRALVGCCALCWIGVSCCCACCCCVLLSLDFVYLFSCVPFVFIVFSFV